MSIQLVTYANQTVTPTNDAIIYENAIDQNGIFHGCTVTVSGNSVNITGGYGIICGREFVIQGESIAVTLAPSGTLDGRLYVRLDLADADAPIQLLTATGNTLPPLEQDDDVNYTNGAYEMELATFTVGVSSLSDVVETFQTIIGQKEGLINLDTTAASGTDYDLYTALTGVGWADDIDSNLLNLKKLFTEMIGDTGWIELVSGVQYRKRMGFATVKIYMNKSMTTSWQTIGTLPEGYRPSEIMYFAMTTVTNNTNIVASVDSTGEIAVRLPNGASATSYSIEGTVTFPVDIIAQ